MNSNNPTVGSDTKTEDRKAILVVGAIALVLILLGLLAFGIISMKNNKGPFDPERSRRTQSKPVRILEKEAVVKMTDKGFEPQTIIVKKGTTFTFSNESSSYFDLEFLSQVKIFEGKIPKGAKAYAQVKIPAGTYNYFNRANSAQTGAIIVEE